MKVKVSLLALAAVGMVGCASGGGNSGHTGAENGFMHSSPKEFSKEEFSKNPKNYADDMVTYKGGGVDSYKKVTIPSYTLDIRKFMQTVTHNKMAALLAKSDGAKNELTLSVSFPVMQHEAMMRDIASVSYARLVEKFKKTGVEVIPWSEVKAKHKDAVKFEQEKMFDKPVVDSDSMVSFSAPGLLRPDSGVSMAYALSSLSRETEVSIILPKFGIGFGYFDGAKTPYTITEAHGMTSVQFTPQIQILSGSGFDYQSKWNGGGVILGNTLVANQAFVSKLVKEGDSRAAANERGEKTRGAVMGVTGAKSHEVTVSTSAALNYEVAIQPEEFKKLALAELDSAENLIVQRYKTEL